MPYLHIHAPCWCFLCGGRRRTQQTIARHAQNQRRIDVVIDRTSEYPVEFAPERGQDESNFPRLRRITEETRALLHAYDLYFAKQDCLDEKLWDDDDIAPSLGLLITMHLDWISTFRVSDVSAGHIWGTIRSLLSAPDADAAGPLAHTTYDRILRFVKKHKLETVQKIPICPCGKVIYYDFCNDELRKVFKYCSATERNGCAICGLSKFIPGTEKPRKVIYYIPVEIWLRDLFQRADLAAVLRSDTDPSTFSTGSLRRSEGWKSKVTDNPRMSSDPRHAPLVGHADGGPYFKGGEAGAWFFILRHASLPEPLLLEQTLAHMPLLISNEHWEDEKGDGAFKKVWRCAHDNTQHTQQFLKAHFIHATHDYAMYK